MICKKCGNYNWNDKCNCKQHRVFVIADDDDYTPDDDDWDDTYVGGRDYTVKAERLAQAYYEYEPDELSEHYVFIDDKKFVVTLEPSVIYSAKEITNK